MPPCYWSTIMYAGTSTISEEREKHKQVRRQSLQVHSLCRDVEKLRLSKHSGKGEQLEAAADDKERGEVTKNGKERKNSAKGKFYYIAKITDSN